MASNSENLKASGRVLKNFSFLAMGKVLGDFFTFILFVVLSRYYGQEGIGQYSFAVALTGLLMVAAEFGLLELSVKEMSRIPDSMMDYFGEILSLRLILVGVLLSVLFLVVLFGPFDREAQVIILIVGINQVIYTLLSGFKSVFIARENMFLSGALEFSAKAAAAAVAVTLILSGADMPPAIMALPCITLAHIFLGGYLVRKQYGRVRLHTVWRRIAATLRQALPYGTFTFLGQLATRLDVILLGFLLGAAAVGIYNVAYRVVFLLLFLPYFAGLALFPLASQLAASSRDELNALFHRALQSTVLLAVPVTALLWLVAPALIDLVFGDEFAESGPILRLLTILVIFACINSIMGIFLTACDRQPQRTRIQWIAVLLNGSGNLVLIPIFGIIGAAASTVLSEGVAALLITLHLKGLFGWPRVASRLAISGVATLVFCAAFWLLDPPLLVLIPLSGVLYVLGLLVFSEIRNNEVKTLLAMWKS